MKVKRIIKAFIYLFPVIVVLVTALANTFYRFNKNYGGIIKETTGNTSTTYIYSSTLNDGANPLDNGLEQFNNIMVDIDPDLYDNVSNIVHFFWLNDDNNGTFMYFVTNFIAYEFIALLINVVIDVIFIVPELFYKFEDESIMSRKKKRR